MGPANRQLQPRPKPLDPVNVTVAINILPCAMVHRLMLETGLGKPAVGFQFVGMNGAVFHHVFFDDRLKCFLANVRDNVRHYVAVSFQHPEHDRLVRGTATALPTGRTTTDIGFVRFNIAANSPLTKSALDTSGLV